MRGGSRYGAGRPGWRRKIEHQLKLDIRVMRRRGWLTPGRSFQLNWSRDGEQIASVGAETHSDYLMLRYTWSPGGNPRSIDCRVYLPRTSCRFGGNRVWFYCPDCDRRCAVLYGVSRYGNFACRMCQNLAYASESESPLDRCWRAQRKLEALLDEIGEPAKGMRMKTFERISEKLERIEEKKDGLWFIGLARMATTLGFDPDTLFE